MSECVTLDQLHQYLKQKAIDAKISQRLSIDTNINNLRNSISMQYVNQSDLSNFYDKLEEFAKSENYIEEEDSEQSDYESSVSAEQNEENVTEQQKENEQNQQKQQQNNQQFNRSAEKNKSQKRNSKRKTTKKYAQDHILYLKIEDQKLLNDWNFNITKIEDKKEKLRLVFAMFQIAGTFNFLKIEKDIFYNFLLQVYDKYQKFNNPFHNFDHGFTVTHSMFYFIINNIGTQYFKTIDKFTLLLSSLGHDLEHTGKNNAFECASMSELALKYNDDSVLENHHVSTLFTILKQKDTNIIQNLSKDDFKYLRRFCISNILSTDMKKHFECLTQFESKLTEFAELSEADKNQFFNNEVNMKLLQGSLVHSADLSGPTKVFEIAKSWSLNISQEFTNIVNEEEKLGLPVTPYLVGLTNLKKISQEEQGFIKAIIRPLWVVIVKFNSDMQFALDNIDANLVQWEKIHQEEIVKSAKQQI